MTTAKKQKEKIEIGSVPDTMNMGIYLLTIAIFFAGAAFQEAITFSPINHPDGGQGSITLSVFAFLLRYVLITKHKGQGR